MTLPQTTDFLVIGTGIAGLSYALKVAEHGRVVIVTKKHSAESNTNYAQGGIAAVMTPEDSFAQHIEDTLVAGAGLCDPEIVEMVVSEGPARVRELIALGAAFTRKDGALHLGREGGHSANRIIHAADATGREVEQALLHKVQTHPNITISEYYFAVDLLVERKGSSARCYGALVIDEQTNQPQEVQAPTTLLASGGAGRVYAHTTNPAIATGDGVAMAYRAGARIANMEFFQFHPTALYHPQGGSFLITEAVRGEGGILTNQRGERFMLQYHPLAELAPRDVVACAIDEQLKTYGDACVYLDISHKPQDYVREHFPTIYDACLKLGIDITRQPIPVVPAAHYQCGGVWTNRHAETTLPGLLACGEVAYTGLHGANRLASNSLLEAMVFSHHAALRAIAERTHLAGVFAAQPAATAMQLMKRQPVDPSAAAVLHGYQQEIKSAMWSLVGIIRSNERLHQALKSIEALNRKFEHEFAALAPDVLMIETRNLLINAVLIIRSALERKESRGLHRNVDYPDAIKQEARPTIVAEPLDDSLIA